MSCDMTVGCVDPVIRSPGWAGPWCCHDGANYDHAVDPQPELFNDSDIQMTLTVRGIKHPLGDSGLEAYVSYLDETLTIELAVDDVKSAKAVPAQFLEGTPGTPFEVVDNGVRLRNADGYMSGADCSITFSGMFQVSNVTGAVEEVPNSKKIYD
eukprot:Hpha_TRINITY_DN15488_c5_g1::TRINITY_DN15488_c5_g1_i1::g.175637::m.175637